MGDHGIDLAFLNDRIGVSFDYFRHKTKDLLTWKQADTETGLDTYLYNGGELTNRGFEIALSAKVLDTKPFKWNAELGIARYKNEISALPDGDYTTEILGGEVLTAVGHPAGVFYGYEAHGVYATEAEAQAAKILADANTKAQDVEKNAMTEISLAGKQALSKIKSEISSMIIAKSTAPAVKAATLDPEFVKQMLLTVAKNWSGADSSKNQLKALLPEAEQKAFEATFEAAAKELLAAGVEVGYSKEVRTGFKVGAKEGGYYISFADADIEALLAEYLRDKVFQLLFKA